MDLLRGRAYLVGMSAMAEVASTACLRAGHERAVHMQESKVDSTVTTGMCLKALSRLGQKLSSARSLIVLERSLKTSALIPSCSRMLISLCSVV